MHERIAHAWMTLDNRSISLADCPAFVLMADLGIQTAFAFDPHFVRQGFSLAGD